MKVAILFSNYGPYHLARISSFYKACRKAEWQVIGIEFARFENEYPWQAQVKSLPFSIISASEGQGDLKQSRLIGLIKRLNSIFEQVRPDVLAIAGYSHPAMFSALLWCLWRQKPALLLSASKEDDAPRTWWQEKIKSWVVRGYKAALVGGKPQQRYLVKLGMPSEAIFSGYNVVGNEAFHPAKIRVLGKPLKRPYFLAINRFVSKKNLLRLLDSYATYRQGAGSQAWDLVLCGDGELRPQIKQRIIELGLEGVVHLPGFLQQDDLLPFLAHASCFVHVSIQEQWGLVINEAMAAGLPVIVSNRCGCFEDLVIEGVNGFGFDPENSQQLTDLMLKVSSGEIDLTKMGNAALEHIQQFSPDYFANSLNQAIEYALSHR